ncbi:MAG TPA: hypothetical protein VGK29_18030 [Paludibaculum sp.]|jgi:hypothetical protein
MKPPKLELKLKSEPKWKTGVLIGLLLLAAYLFYTNILSTGTPEADSKPVAKAPAVPVAAPKVAAEKAGPRVQRDLGPSKAGPREFRPSLKPKKGEEGNSADIDPTLRTDLLAKLTAVRIEQADRSLFDFGGSADPSRPKLPEPKIVVKAKPAPKMIGPELPPPPPPPVVKPPPPPIPLKFYGAALPLRGGVRRVFCMQGDDVLTPGEGEVVQKRYKIIRITPTNVVVEDLEYKNEQTLPIEQAVAAIG